MVRVRENDLNLMWSGRKTCEDERLTERQSSATRRRRRLCEYVQCAAILEGGWTKQRPTRRFSARY